MRLPPVLLALPMALLAACGGQGGGDQSIAFLREEGEWRLARSP